MIEKIKSALADAGFDAVGVTSADPMTHDAARFGDWLKKGHAARMDYLRRDPSFRGDPGHLLPGARSVIVAAAACPPSKCRLSGARGGPIASFGLYRDYHDLLFAALEKGEAAIAECDDNARCRLAVDASPILERALAVRAGLGRIGYSTNLLTPRYGPFVHLGLIVTTLPLAPDPSADPADSLCESCGQCIKDCPTGALLEPRVLDANRCISYLTIEKKGPFTDWEANAIEGWAFGCDICSKACFKRKGQSPFPEGAGSLMRAHRYIETDDLEIDGLKTLLDLCEGGFKKSFRKTPMFRCGKGGLIRNILTAAKNLNLPWVSERAIPHLKGGTEASRDAAARAVS